jgi:hypothetical protein
VVDRVSKTNDQSMQSPVPTAIYRHAVFHVGETLGDGTTADMNLYDAILLGIKGIGVWTWIECTVLHEVECRLTGICAAFPSHWPSIPN